MAVLLMISMPLMAAESQGQRQGHDGDEARAEEASGKHCCLTCALSMHLVVLDRASLLLLKEIGVYAHSNVL